MTDDVATAQNIDTSPAAPKGKRKMITVSNALAAALEAYNKGNFDRAEAFCREVIKARPRNAEAFNLLGIVLHSKGDTREAIKAVKKATALNGSLANYHSNLGEMNRLVGRLGDAVVSLRRALTLNPNYVQAHNNLGITYFDKKDYERSVTEYQKAIELAPKYAEAHNNLGNALRALDRMDEAFEFYNRAIEIRANYPEAFNNLATAYRDSGEPEKAEETYRKALELKPDYYDAKNNLAALYISQDNYDGALAILGEILKIDDKNIRALISAARAQMQRANYAAAQIAAKRALELEPENAEVLCVNAQVAHDLDDVDGALDFYERALAIKPDYAECYNSYGVALKSKGEIKKAREAFFKTLELKPKAFGAFSNLADTETFTPDNPVFLSMKKVIDEADDPKKDRYLPVHYALGKAYTDMGEYENGFEHYQTGSALKRARLNYDAGEMAKFFDGIKEAFTKETFTNPPFRGHPSAMPIFVLGMPRSGSTLTEQIISAHPDVYGAGEIKMLNFSIGTLRQQNPSIPPYPAMIGELKPGHYQAIAHTYLDRISRYSDTALKVTDKMLTNYFFCGLIHLLFPNAKIIHTRRDPMDTCLSCYTKLFKEDMPHTYDLQELGGYYRMYEGLMEHWWQVLPDGVMLDLKYETLVNDFDEEVRKLIDFCGLDWNDACLRFHESDRPVKTASVAQVRKPIFTGSIGKWKNFENQLAPLHEALGL